MLFSIKVIHDTMITVPCCVRILLLDRLFFSYSFCPIRCGFIYICSRFVWISSLPWAKHIHLPNKIQTKYFQRNQFPVVCARGISIFLTLSVIDCDTTWHTKTYPPPKKKKEEISTIFWMSSNDDIKLLSATLSNAEITAAINIANYTIKWP